MLSEDFMRTLHKRMLGDVWEWAGTFRTTERNIGVQ
jgi:fido (protein-threonine AMPylation protein)